MIFWFAWIESSGLLAPAVCSDWTFDSIFLEFNSIRDRKAYLYIELEIFPLLFVYNKFIDLLNNF